MATSALIALQSGLPVAARDAATRVAELGFENIRVDSVGQVPSVSFENRRYRHSAESFGLLERAMGGPVRAYEQRFGLTAALVETPAYPGGRFRVRYPSDLDYPEGPSGPVMHPTARSVDFELGPLLAYEFGRISTPVQLRFELEPRLTWNPWAGGRLLATLIIPIYNDFLPSSNHPDIEQLRPGIVTFDQYGWVPKVALTSISAGIFADNRYGVSFGAARPMAQGSFLLDTQADYTGFLAFPKEGISYSNPSKWTAAVGLTYRPPWWDVALRAQVSEYLFNDRGFELKATRTMGEVEVSAATQWGLNDDYRNITFRAVVPIPPMVRPTQQAVRFLPISRFPFSYRTDATPIATAIVGAASREEFLRQLNSPSLEDNRYRYENDRAGVQRQKIRRPIHRVNISGVSGFINTPGATILEDREIELGWNKIPAKWAYDGRPDHTNEVYYAAMGILPRVEATLRFTRIPGLKGGLADEENLITTDTDHMISGRFILLHERPGRPGLAVGMDDAEGTKRYHSTYGVLGLPIEIFRVQNRISLGYAPTVFTAARHVLDGFFGAVEVSPWRAVAAQVEYDTEKWNLGLSVGFDFGLRLRAAALDMQHLSVGIGWYHKL